MSEPKHDFTRGTYDAAEIADALGDPGFKEAVVASLTLLGTALVKSPKTEDFAMALDALRGIDLVFDWPFGSEGDLAACARLFSQGEEEGPHDLLKAYTRLFRGPAALPAPPWGSVYMDRDQVMYGWTWVELRNWMRASGVVGTYEENDPEDHLGRLLLMAASVAAERPDLFGELMSDHVLCWSGHFLDQFCERAASPTYAAVGLLAKATLGDLGQMLEIEPPARKFFR